MWRWRCKYVPGASAADAIEQADDLLRRLAEVGAIPPDLRGQPTPAVVHLNPSGVSATITYYGDEPPD